MRLFKPRTAFAQSLSLSPRDDLSGDFIITPTKDDADLNLLAKASQNVNIVRSDGNVAVEVPAAGGLSIKNGDELTLTGGNWCS